MSKARWFLFPVPWLLFPLPALAHCPLCTAGVGVLAVWAAWMGVDPASIGVFVGAFGIVTGLWVARLLRRAGGLKLRWAIAGASFALTVLPLAPLFDVYSAFSIFWTGDYGTWLNRTYLLNRFVVGSLVGGGLVLAAPFLSRTLTCWRKRQLPYQGLTITLLSLILAAELIEWIL